MQCTLKWNSSVHSFCTSCPTGINFKTLDEGVYMAKFE